ncbi:MAG TPA: hypothetical protein VHP83_09390 [Aggregatilineaceae bacterium]|nr:hypothetical protein [Aggregatilineaceae bacterium]
MARIFIVDNDYITVEYLADHRIIQHTIHKPVGGHILRDALNAGTAALEQYGACKWLSDDRKNGPLSTEEADWGFNDWNARTMNAGWKYWALVVPPALEAAGSLIPTIEDLHERGLRVMTFTDLESALNWLDNMPD